MSKIAPVEGWMLDAIVAYDARYPGFAGHYLRSSVERRQVIAALFSSGRHLGKSVSDDLLARGKHNAILADAFDCVPTGFRRALAKSGPKPHQPDYYTTLRDMLDSGPSRVIDVVRQSPTLNPERLQIIKSLPFDLCDIRIVNRIESVRQAQDLKNTVEFFHNRTAKRDELVNALMTSKKPLTSVMRRWCRNIQYIDHPIPRSERYRPIVDGVELHAIARRYQNCSRNYTVAALTGESAFGEFTAQDTNVLLCFEKHKGIWTLEGAYGRRNRSLKEGVEADARKFAEQHGIPGRWDVRHSEDGVEKALQRIIRPYSDW